MKIDYEREQSQVNMVFIEWATHMLQWVYTMRRKYVSISKSLKLSLVRIVL